MIKDQELQNLIRQMMLPEQYLDYIPHYFDPIVEMIVKKIVANQQQAPQQFIPPVIGINGSQGSGKTTAAQILQFLLENRYEYKTVILSIDDFYHTQATRKQLADSIHPLFITRGVPGTHDIGLATETIERIQGFDSAEHAAYLAKNVVNNVASNVEKSAKNQIDNSVLIPRFDKSTDDRKAKSDWDVLQHPADVIIFEGWCVGALPVDTAHLQQPINNLEAKEDKYGVWRQAVNDFLTDSYQSLFQRIDWLLMLKAPSFDVVYEWRLLQEQKLAQALADQTGGNKSGLQNEAQLKRFIQHYQRITENCLQVMPDMADAVIGLDELHQMVSLRMKA